MLGMDASFAAARRNGISPSSEITKQIVYSHHSFLRHRPYTPGHAINCMPRVGEAR